MRKPFIKYTFALLAAYLLAVLINVILLKNYFLDPVTMEANITLQTVLSPLNFIILTAIGCFLHWRYIGRKQVRVLSGQAAAQLSVVAASAMIGFIAGTVGFFALVFQAARHEPLFGLFIFILPGVSLMSAVLGALAGIGIALYKKRKKIKSVFSAK